MLTSRYRFVLDKSSSLESDHKVDCVSWSRGSHLQHFLKRSVDLLGAFVLIFLFFPIFIIVSLLVVLEDGRPIIYRRRVVGIRGEFDAFKFRTMRRDADSILASNPSLRAEFERNFKLKDDPRVTKVGAFLRKSSLDELPQLFNVLRGQMSLVGPRMVTTPELGKYGSHRQLLLSVKPGLTGYWQVRGRQNVSYEERVTMDVYYIENWSVWLDVQIVLLTLVRWRNPSA